MTPSATKPSHWPPGVSYINAPRYHSSVTAVVRSQLQNSQKSAHASVRTRSERSLQRPPVIIMQIKDENHPAKGQYGLFASKKISPRSLIINYIGEVHCDDRPGSDYDLSLLRLQDGLSVGIDASRYGNESRFVNDFRGVAERPNVYFHESVNEAGEICISIWSGSNAIKKGDELLVSYGKGFWKARN